MEVARVQYLHQTKAATTEGEVPSQYIQTPELRPNPKSSSGVATTVPVIDLSSPHATVLSDINTACREWGAFQVINHGVPDQLLDDVRAVSLGFYTGCDKTQKMKYARDVPGCEGYGSQMIVSNENDLVMDWRDLFYHNTFPLSRRRTSCWPEFPSNYKQVVEEYCGCIKELTQKLLALASESLGAKPSCIEDAVGEIYQNIVISYYPPCPQPELTLGVQAHTDYGAMTLLLQDDVGGLEVLKDGEWIPVNPIQYGIIVTVADQTEVITNGAHKSAVHRVVTNPSKSRVSLATFHDPAPTRKIEPSSELVGESASPPRYREVVYGDYVRTWYKHGPEGKRNVDALLM